MSFGIPVRNGLSISLLSTTALSTGRRLIPALNLNFLSGALDPRITFSRGSNATLTDSTGRITYAPANFVTNSDGPQSSTGTTVSSGVAVAPNGTTTARRIAKTDATTPRYAAWSAPFTAQSNTSYVASAYFKYDGYDTQVSLEYNNAAQWGAVSWVAPFNVTASGVTAVAPSSCTSGVQAVGNGWFRVWAAFTTGTVSTAVTTILTRVTGGSGVSVLTWGGQIEPVTYQTTPGTYNSTTPKNLLGYTQEFDNAAWTKSNAFVQTNLLTYSQDFGNAAWAVSDTTATSNVSTAPDGSATADRVAETATTAFHAVVQTLATVSATNHVLSIYLKKGSGATAPDWVQLTFGGASTSYANFNLATGVVGVVSGLTANITSVGSGWYRCSVIVAIPTAGALSVQVVFTNNTDSATRRPSYAGATTSDVLLWGAQLVQGSTAGDYQRTDAAAAAVQYTAPDGTLSADKLVETTVNGGHYVLQSITALAIPYTFSAYVKAAERTFAMIYNAQTNAGQVINLATGALAGNAGLSAPTSSSVTDVGNGWYLLSMTITATAASNNFRIYAMSDATTFNYAGDGTSGIYIWGAQLSDSASLDPYVYNPAAAAASAAYYGPRFDYDPVTLAAKGLLIEEARTNLLTYSAQFDDAAWAKARGSITANTTTSPDGTISADTLTATATGTYAAAYRASVSYPGSTAYTLSVYAKASAGQYLILYINETGDVGRAVFDLSSGAISLISSGTTASITSVGNGWWRCVVTATPSVTSSAIVIAGVVDSGASTSVTTGKSIYLYGAQLEAGSFATSYIPTVASTVTRTYDVANIVGSNFASWYNQNEGTFAVEFDYSGGASSDNINARYVFDATNGGSVNIRHSIYNRSTTAQSGLTVDNGVLQANPAASGTLFANTVTKAAYAFKTNDFAFSYNGGAAITDNSGTVPTSINRMSIGSALLGDLAQLGGHIRSIRYYNTRLPNTTLQTLTAPPTTTSLFLDFTTQVFNVG